jgi:hypothetical protein
MAHIRSKLLSRLTYLECRLAEEICTGSFIVTVQIPENDLESLPDGQRIVLDCYRNQEFFIEARQRVTRDPKDDGRHREPGGYLLDVLQEVHAACTHRAKPGVCSSCRGTPVAGT